MIAEMSELTKRYGRREAVHQVSPAINPGEVVGLLGPNGAGKTTSLKLLAGLLFPDSGTVQIMGVPPVRPGLKSRICRKVFMAG